MIFADSSSVHELLTETKGLSSVEGSYRRDFRAFHSTYWSSISKQSHRYGMVGSVRILQAQRRGVI